jgi:hypothetical protein
MDDGFLIRQVLSGNRNAFRLLVVRYQRPVFRLLGGLGFEAAYLPPSASALRQK